MASPTTTPASVREVFAHVLQLCHYVEDLHCARSMKGLEDWSTVLDKAKQIKTLIMEK